MGVGGAIANVVTSPALISAMTLYGSVRVGQMVITSKMMKKGIINILKNPKAALAKPERVALQNLVRALPDIPEEENNKVVTEGQAVEKRKDEPVGFDEGISEK